MARIRATRVRAGTRVSVSGRFAASDMGRLEHACGEALTRDPLRLQLDLTRVSEMDDTAAAVVAQLRHRGANVRTIGDRAAFESTDHGRRSTVQQ